MSVTKISKTKWRAIASYRVDGKLRQPSKVFPSEKEAWSWERTEMLRRDASTSKAKFSEVLELYVEKKKGKVNDETLFAMRYKANHFMEKLLPLKLSVIKPILLENWRTQLLATEYSDKYKNEIINQCKAMFKLAAKMYEIKDPSIHLETIVKAFTGDVEDEDEEKIKRILTVLEFQQIYNPMPEITPADRYHKAFVMATWSTGWRRGEGKAIQEKNFHNLIFEVRKAASGKSKGDRSKLGKTKTRTSVRGINVDDYCGSELERLLTFSRNVEGWNPNWFMFGGPKPMCNTQILDRWRNALIYSGLFEFKCPHCDLQLTPKNVNMKYKNFVICPNEACKQKVYLETPVRFHDLRHSHATLLINSGVPVSAVSARLGHSSINMTLKVYTHATKDAVQVLIQNLPNLHFVDNLLTREENDKQKSPS